MKSFLASLTSVALKRPLTIALICGLLVAGLGVGIAKLQFDNRPDAFFLKDDPTVETWRDFKQLYASDEFSVVVLTPPEIDLDFIRELRDLTFDLDTLEGVTRVTSLINVRSIRDDDGDLDVGEYLREDLPAEEQLARLADAATHPHYSGLYLNEDATAFAVLIETVPDFTTQDKLRFTGEVRARIETLPFPAYGIGAPVLDTDVQTIVGSESGLFGALTFAMVLAGFALAYRSWVGLALPLAVSVGSVLGSLGIMGHLGAAAGILTPIVPSFLISVGLGASVYLLTPFHRALRDGGTRKEAVRHAVSEAGPAALVAGLTTIVALFAFSGSRVLPVREVGLTLGIGLLIALVLTFLLFPVLGSRLPVPRNNAAAEVRRDPDRITALLSALARNSLERPRRMVAGFCALIVLALIGVAQLRTDYDYLGTFKASTRIVQDYRAANGEIPVSNSIELVVHTGQTDAFKQPDALRALERLAENALQFATDDLPLKSYSLADVVKELAQETQGTYAIPDERNTVSQLLFLFESSGHDELSRLTNFDFDQARITLLVPTRPYGDYTPIIDSLRANAPAIFADHGIEGAELVITGVVPLWMQLSGFLTETQIQSFVYAALAVAMIMMLIFRSIRLGLVMAGLNIGCVVLVLGAMGWAGIALDPFTILIGAIALGILDDDTIHFVRSALSRLEAGEGLSDAVHATFQSTGRAIGLQTIVLVIAFVVYLFSSVASLSLFGALTATAILIALAVEFLVTPALLVLVLRRQHSVKRLS